MRMRMFGKFYWKFSIIIHNLLTFAVVIGLQNYLFDKLNQNILEVTAAALPQQLDLRKTAPEESKESSLVENFQFNAFDTTRTTSYQSSSSSSSSATVKAAAASSSSSLSYLTAADLTQSEAEEEETEETQGVTAALSSSATPSLTSAAMFLTSEWSWQRHASSSLPYSNRNNRAAAEHNTKEISLLPTLSSVSTNSDFYAASFYSPEGAAAASSPLSSSSSSSWSSSSMAYPTSTSIIAAFPNTKTSRIIRNHNSSNQIKSLSTNNKPSGNGLIQTVVTGYTPTSSWTTSSLPASHSSMRTSESSFLYTTKHENLKGYATAAHSSRRMEGGALGGAALGFTNSHTTPSFRNFMKSTTNMYTTNSAGPTSSGTTTTTTTGAVSHSGPKNKKNVKQQLPLDYTFSKNHHWTDAALQAASINAFSNMNAAIVDAPSVQDIMEGGQAAGKMSAGVSNSNHYRLGTSATSSSSATSLASSSSSSSATSAFTLHATNMAVTERPRIFRNKHHHDHHWGPFFEQPLNSNSTTNGAGSGQDSTIAAAHLYTEAVLNCRVGMLKDKTVMWVRRTSEKVSLLTVGNVTYSSDPRIRVKFQYPNNWRLLINPTQWDDAGIYMCQVSTHPPRVFTTNLTVIEPPLRLIDDQERDVGDRYYKTGSTIDLQCQVSRSFLYKEKQNILKSLKPLLTQTNLNSLNNHNNLTMTSSSGSNSITSPSSTSSIKSNNQTNYKLALANNKSQQLTATSVNGEAVSSSSIGSSYNDLIMSLNQTLDKQGIALEKQFSNLVFWSKDDEELPAAALKRISSNDKWLTSRVTITDAKFSDTGNYSCSIGRLFTAIVQVQVLTGELPAAVQHNAAATIQTATTITTTLLLPLLLQLLPATAVAIITTIKALIGNCLLGSIKMLLRICCWICCCKGLQAASLLALATAGFIVL